MFNLPFSVRLWAAPWVLVGGLCWLGAEGRAATVPVVRLPGDAIEVVAADGFGGQALKLGPAGELLSWTDEVGNPLVSTGGKDWQDERHALEILDPAKPNARLLPHAKGVVEIGAEEPGRRQVRVRHPEGVTLVFVVEFGRIGIRVEGPAAEYLVRGRAGCRMEGCRLVPADGAARFASASLGSVVSPRQTWVDARATRALELSRESGGADPPAPITWSVVQTDGWAWVREHVAWETRLAKGQTLWLASVPAPRHDGPVAMGLHARTVFRPQGAALAKAILSTAEWTAGRPETIALSQPGAELVKDGRVFAALFPSWPEDAVEAAEQGAWFSRFDRSSGRMIGLSNAHEVRGVGFQPVMFQGRPDRLEAYPTCVQVTPPADLVADNWIFLQGIQSRQISFGLHHSIEEHVQETLRKHLVFAQAMARHPDMLGTQTAPARWRRDGPGILPLIESCSNIAESASRAPRSRGFGSALHQLT